MFSNVKKNSRMFSVLKIVYLTTLYLVLCINFSVEVAVLSVTVKLTDIDSKVRRTHRHLPINVYKVKPSAKSLIRRHLLFCNYEFSFDSSNILEKEAKFLLEIKESLLIKWNKPILNKQKHQFRSICFIWQRLNTLG